MNKIIFLSQKEGEHMDQQLQNMIIAGVTVYYICKLIDYSAKLIIEFFIQ